MYLHTTYVPLLTGGGSRQRRSVAQWRAPGRKWRAAAVGSAGQPGGARAGAARGANNPSCETLRTAVHTAFGDAWKATGHHGCILPLIPVHSYHILPPGVVSAAVAGQEKCAENVAHVTLIATPHPHLTDVSVLPRRRRRPPRGRGRRCRSPVRRPAPRSPPRWPPAPRRRCQTTPAAPPRVRCVPMTCPSPLNTQPPRWPPAPRRRCRTTPAAPSRVHSFDLFSWTCASSLTM